MTKTTPKRLGFFSRLLDKTDAAGRYRLVTEQVAQAERSGFDSAWIAQHHFHEAEGGLPAPFVFLAHLAAHTSRIRLGTGIVTLPLELPIRVAEDAAVLDLMCGHRLEVGVGPGGNMTAFAAFGLASGERHRLFSEHLDVLRTAWSGGALPGGDRLYPPAPTLVGRIWQATFTVEGARRAGLAGDGLMLSRTQPRPLDRPDATLADIQNPMIDAYLAALPGGVTPRILASRTVFATDDREDAVRFAKAGLMSLVDKHAEAGMPVARGSLEDLVKSFDVHMGTPSEVVGSLLADSTLERATDLTMQVHSIDPPHPHILRSIELMADKVAPALGWTRDDAAGVRKVA
ncbi:MAG: putative FMN-dependent luciferase-like monooxygenase [Rhodospirillales bacterium]|nr:MAG: putative FMN-dependent luciferase-like monooxygenase [Rhodospirillales bacterium]